MNRVGIGEYSIYSAPVVTFGVPGFPRNVEGTADYRRVPLKWLAPVSDNGDPIKDYVIQYSSNNERSWITFNDGLSPNQYVPAVSGLADATTYVFRVAATNRYGMGQFSSMSAPIKTLPAPKSQ